MPSSPRAHRWPARRGGRRLPRPDRRRALELLAGCGGEGCIDSLMFANGFTAEILLELIRAQLVSANPERTITDSKTIEVTRLRITDAGRRVFEGANP
jgi:hypothetical protein